MNNFRKYSGFKFTWSATDSKDKAGLEKSRFLAKQKEAGADIIIAEMQKQIDAWVAAKK